LTCFDKPRCAGVTKEYGHEVQLRSFRLIPRHHNKFMASLANLAIGQAPSSNSAESRYVSAPDLRPESSYFIVTNILGAVKKAKGGNRTQIQMTPTEF
jgi:hypothetical protein